MKTRAEFSKYIVSALKMLNFRNVICDNIKIHFQHFRISQKNWIGEEIWNTFKMLSLIDEGSSEVKKLCWFEDEDIFLAVQFWYISGDNEISRFIKKEFTEKSAMTEIGIQFGTNRVREGQMFPITKGFNEESLDSKVQLDVIKMTL